MNIVVCVKQVPNTNEVKINQETGTLIRDGVESIINPDDRHAIEAALCIKDKCGARVKVLSMGPLQAKEAIKEALAMGADEGYLISDRAFAGSDTWATATILAAAVEKLGSFDYIFCGRQAIDGDTAQVGPEIAEFLGIPHISYAKHIEIEGDEMLVTRYSENGDYKFAIKPPCLLTSIKDLNVPRFPNVSRIFEIYDYSDDEKIKLINFADLTVDPSQIGIKGSPTNVHRSFVPVKSKENEWIEADTEQEKAKLLVNKLVENKLI